MSVTGKPAPVPGVDIDLEDDTPPRKVLTAERLRDLIHYDPKSGIMTRRTGRPGVRAGSTAGSRSRSGYVCVSIDGRSYRRSRLAWLYMTGSWPTHEMDHRNGDKEDDRFSNLREATRVENCRNTRPWSRHGVKGVCYHARRRERNWEASVWADSRRKSLGYFGTKAEAAAAAEAANEKLHQGFASSKRRAKPQTHLSFADHKLGEKLVDFMFEEEALAAEHSTAEAA